MCCNRLWCLILQPLSLIPLNSLMGLICSCQTSAFYAPRHIHCLDCNVIRQTHVAYMFNGLKHMQECTRTLSGAGKHIFSSSREGIK